MAVFTVAEQKFIEALEKGDLDTVDVMLSSGEARVTQPLNDYSSQPIHMAAGRGNPALIDLLVRHGADVNAADKDGDTPLMEAAKGNRPEALEKLIALGAERNTRAKSGMTALFNSAMEGKLKIVEILTDSGADVNIGTDSGLTPIFAAALRGHLEVARHLVDCGAKLDQNGHGLSVTEFAERIGGAGGDKKRVADFLAGTALGKAATGGTAEKTAVMKPLSFKKPS